MKSKNSKINKPWNKRTGKELTVLGLKISVMEITVGAVIAIGVVFLAFWLDFPEPEPDLVPDPVSVAAPTQERPTEKETPTLPPETEPTAIHKKPIDKLGLIPTGGHIDNQPAAIHDTYGYLTYENLNRKERFTAYLEEKYYDTDITVDGLGGFDKCALNLVATNKSDYEMFITGFRCEISNIRQINEPLLLAYAAGSWEMNGADFIEAEIANCGWVDAKDVFINIADQNHYLKSLLQAYPHEINVGIVPQGQMIQTALIKNDQLDLDQVPPEGISIEADGLISYADENETTYEHTMFIEPFRVTPNGIIGYGGRGAVTFNEFGIMIDAEESEMVVQKKVYEVVEPQEVIDLPMMLSANRSCLFDLEIEMTINYSETAIWGKFDDVELFVSSLGGPSLIDGDLIDEYIVSESEGDIVYFPYNSATN